MKLKTVRKKQTSIKPSDYPDRVVGEYVDYECKLLDEEGETLALYVRTPKEIETLARTISKNTKPQKKFRTFGGLPQLSTVYGALPRIPMRNDYCRFSSQTRTERDNANLAFELNKKLSEFYEKNLPEEFKRAVERVQSEVDDSYRVVKTPWTTININLNQVIKYHYDKGNNSVDLSNVIIVKEGVKGGHLALPEYDLTLSQDDGFMVFFKGQEILHGVTPCTFKNKHSYRSSIVHYTLSTLKNCYPYKQEIQRFKEVKSNQAINKLKKKEELRKILEHRRKKN